MFQKENHSLELWCFNGVISKITCSPMCYQLGVDLNLAVYHYHLKVVTLPQWIHFKRDVKSSLIHNRRSIADIQGAKTSVKRHYKRDKP